MRAPPRGDETENVYHHLTLDDSNDHDEPEPYLEDTDAGQHRHLKAEQFEALNNTYLAPPFHHPPLRPLSPDTVSNLSVDDYQRPHTPVVQPSTAQPDTWRGRLHAFWIRNLGLLFMLIAQVFGTAMNVTTRILEIEGNDGKGFHPFQVRHESRVKSNFRQMLTVAPGPLRTHEHNRHPRHNIYVVYENSLFSIRNA